jgi:hypothetical protein
MQFNFTKMSIAILIPYRHISEVFVGVASGAFAGDNRCDRRGDRIDHRFDPKEIQSIGG